MALLESVRTWLSPTTNDQEDDAHRFVSWRTMGEEAEYLVAAHTDLGSGDLCFVYSMDEGVSWHPMTDREFALEAADYIAWLKDELERVVATICELADES